jgi:hypothetical protein
MAGRKPFIPTADHRKMVKAMAGYGIPEDEICKIVINPTTNKPVDGKTLRKHFRDELDTGEIIANSKVAESLYRHATQGTGQGAVTAAIFWLKTRARWKETDRLEVTGKDGGPIQKHSITTAEFREIAKNIADEV